MNFYYQDMDIYYLAQGLLDHVLDISKKHSPLPNKFMSQFEDLVAEIPLMVARMSGEYGKKIPDTKLLKIRAKVFECQAMVELLWRRKILNEKDADDLGDTLLVIANMLTDKSANKPREQLKVKKEKQQTEDESKKIPIYKPRNPFLED